MQKVYFYVDGPIGINTVGKTIKELEKVAKIDSFLTNRSLRASCVTILHNDEFNIPEQVIAEQTGHHQPNNITSNKEKLKLSFKGCK